MSNLSTTFKITDEIFNEKDVLLNQLIFHTRGDEVRSVIEAIQNDRDVIVCGTIGSGRQIMVKIAAIKAKFNFMQFDCMQAQNVFQFLKAFVRKTNHLLKNKNIGINNTEKTLNSCLNGTLLDLDNKGNIRLVIDVKKQEKWILLEVLLDFINRYLQSINERVVLIFRNCSFVEKWSNKKDRKAHIDSWKSFLDKINYFERISYVLLATYGELEIDDLSDVYHETKVKIELKPLPNDTLRFWADEELRNDNMYFSPLDNSREKFLSIVEGSFSDSLSLTRRLKLLYSPRVSNSPKVEIDESKIDIVLNSILNDLSMYFENFLLSLPTTQAQILCSLAIEPTDKPHQKKYANKHGLTSGGSIQSAINSLNRKGVIYKPEHMFDSKYRVSLPLLSIWIKCQRSLVNGT